MTRRAVSSGAVWEPLVGYSRAVRVGPWISVVGTTAAAEGGGAVGGDESTLSALIDPALLVEVEADAYVEG